MHYRERLWAPASWWGIGLFFAVSFTTVVGFTVSPWVGLVAGAVTTAAVAGALLRYGSVAVIVDDTGLTAGGSLLEWPWLGEVEPLDAAATRRLLGPEADRAAHLVTRGYLRTAVRVGVEDPADPHPYWLVSTRRPRELAAAVAAARSSMQR